MAYIIAITEVFDTFHCINKLVFMQGKKMPGDRNEHAVTCIIYRFV